MEEERSKAYKEAEQERLARERGRALPHYIGKVAKKLATPAKRGKVTSPKRSA